MAGRNPRSRTYAVSRSSDGSATERFARAVYGGAPFRSAQALAAGVLTRHDLRTRFHRVHPRVYARSPDELTRDQRVRAAWLWAGSSSVLCGGTAAFLHGEVYFGPESVDDEVELWLPAWRTPPDGIRVRSWPVRSESAQLNGMAVSTPARTAIDLARLIPSDIRAVAALDAMCHSGGASPEAIAAAAQEMSGSAGVGRVIALLPSVDPRMESPKESEVRLLMRDSGLPPMQPQVTIYDERGVEVCRADFGNRRWKVGIEYDGKQHQIDRTRRDGDSLTAIRVAALGWRIPRITQGIIARPEMFLGFMRQAFEAQGWRP